MIDRAIQDETADPATAGTSHSKSEHKPGTHAAVCRMRIKVIPGSRTTSIVGMLGDRLKIKVAAPPEDGKANAAVCALVAEQLGISSRSVEVIAGASNPEKSLRISGLSAAEVRSKIAAII
jgi:uncharacterized protein